MEEIVFRYIYGIWWYVENILQSLNVKNLKITSESKNRMLMRKYNAIKNNVHVYIEVFYEERLERFKVINVKVPLTRVKIKTFEKVDGEVDSEKSRKIRKAIINNLKLMCLRCGG